MDMKKGIITLIWAAFALGACHDKGEVYDPNYNPELGVSVPDGFEWSTTQKLTVNVEVNDEYNGKYYYAVRVYDKVSTPGMLPIAASGKVTGDMPFSQRIVIPANVSKLYISQVFKKANAQEVVTTKEVTISGTEVNYSFGNSKRSSKIEARDSKIRLKEGATIGKPGEYIIPQGVSISQNGIGGELKDVEVKVEGKLTFNGDAKLHNWEIDVENGGTLEVNGNLWLFGDKKDEDNSSSLENEGYVHITGDLTVSAGASLDNDDNDDGKNMGGCIIVDGEAHFQSDEIELEERSYMSCGNMKLNASNMRIYMGTGAWLKVEGKLTAAQNCEIGFGDGDDKPFQDPEEKDKIVGTKYVALVQVGSWGNKGNGNLITREEILVACTDRGSYDLESWTEDADGEITIVGTTCSGGFGNEEETAAPVCTYALEDQDIDKGDYDMNDIVVVVTSNRHYPKEKIWEIKGQVVAAGATSRIVPYFQYTTKGEKGYLIENKGTVYEAFGLSGNPVPVNTKAPNGKETDKNVTFIVELRDVDNNPQIDQLNFGIEVNGEDINWMEHGTGSGARALQVATLFKYPIERKSIIEAYPGFLEWVTSNKARSGVWYESPVKEFVVTPVLK